MKHSLLIRKTTCLENDILQIEFSVTVAGEVIPCVIWKPNTPIESRTLIAMGHGGAQHKMARSIRDRAIRYATSFKWTTLAIDAPGHGERITQQEAEAERLKNGTSTTGRCERASLS